MNYSTKLSIPRRYLITIAFDRIFAPSTIDGMKQAIDEFLGDIAKLARKSGIRLLAEYSLVRGKSGIHAHIVSNWMPSKRIRDKRHKTRITRIHREPIMALMREHYFRTNNPIERIKKIKQNSHIVRRYVFTQANDNQLILDTGQYTADFTPQLFEKKVHSYYSRPYFDTIKISSKIGCYSQLVWISFAAFNLLFLISLIIIQNRP